MAPPSYSDVELRERVRALETDRQAEAAARATLAQRVDDLAIRMAELLAQLRLLVRLIPVVTVLTPALWWLFTRLR